MKRLILNIEGVKPISKEAQKTILGGAGGGGCNLSKCGCDCAGNVTGPICCVYYIACPQIYTC